MLILASISIYVPVLNALSCASKVVLKTSAWCLYDKQALLFGQMAKKLLQFRLVAKQAYK